VAYTVYSDSLCSMNPRDAGTFNIDESTGAAPNSNTLSFNSAGTFYWQAVFAGDSNNAPASSSCISETLVVGRAGPTITTQASPTTGTAGVAITPAKDMATFVGTTSVAPTGSVSFTLFSNSTCATAVAGMSGSGTISTSTGGVSTASFSVATWTPTAAGTYHWVASYAGDADNTGFTTGCSDGNEQIVVGRAAPTLTTQASPTTGTAGVGITPVKDTATFAGTTSVAPTGSVSFTLYSNSTCATAVTGVSGTGSITTTTGVSTASFSVNWTPPAAGTYHWIASYVGDANNTRFTTICGAGNEQVVVGKAAPTITTQASPTTGTAGMAIAPVKDAATFVGTTSVAPTGSVGFTLYSNSTCTTAVGGVSGNGTITTTAGVSTAGFSVNWTPAAAGTYHWIASYTGDADSTGFTTTCGASNEQIVVGKAAPTLTTQASPTAGTVGVAITPATDTATFVGTTSVAPTGSVSFTLYSNSACTMAVAGVSGNGTISSTTGVSKASFGVNWTPAAAGTYHWIASYAGDANSTGFTTTCGAANEQVVVAKAAPTLTTQATPTTGTAGLGINPVKDTATFAGATSVAPTGSVSFTLYSNSTCTTAVSGVSGMGAISTTTGASTANFNVNWTPAAAGTYHWIASYAGDANDTGFTTSCGATNEQVVVAKAAPTISTTANPTSGGTGSTLQDSATLAKTGTLLGMGSVAFNLYGPGDTSCVTALQSETVTGISGNGPFKTTTGFVAKVVGAYHWTVRFSGDGNNNAASSGCAAEPVVIAQQMSQSTPSTTTCPQFASGFATGLSQIQYTLTGTKIGTVTPGAIAYWVKVASAGTYKITQSVSETSRHLTLVSGSAVYDNYSSTTGSCTAVSRTVTQATTSGAVTVKFSTGKGPFYIGLRFSSTNLDGEAAPKPSTTVQYMFGAGFIGSTSQVNLVFK
jgi:hypothetical protein